VLLFGRVEITSAAVAALLDQQAQVCYLDRRGGLRGRMMGSGNTGVLMRIRQHARWGDEAARVAFASTCVAGKIANCVTLLRRRQRNKSLPAVGLSLEHLERAQARALCCFDFAELLGVEGAPARAYFSCWPSILPADAGFSGRRRRPPPDPVNALLSLTYTLVLEEARSALATRGMDPDLGCLHSVRGARPALALDILEELRPSLCDRFVLASFCRRIVGPSHFETNDGACLMTPGSLRGLLDRWEHHLQRPFPDEAGRATSWRKIIARQAARSADWVAGAAYLPYRLR
jgi:CRISPR-associated protein Cas1